MKRLRWRVLTVQRPGGFPSDIPDQLQMLLCPSKQHNLLQEKKTFLHSLRGVALRDRGASAVASVIRGVKNGRNPPLNKRN